MASGKEKNVIEEIYEKYYKDVYRFVLALSKNPHIAEDITQEGGGAESAESEQRKIESISRTKLTLQIIKVKTTLFCHLIE